MSFDLNSSISSTTETNVSVTSAMKKAELFATLIDVLNAHQVSYCLLSGYDFTPGQPPSDVDLMVHPRDARRLPLLLQAAAEKMGGSLIQIIQHETAAWYTVIARRERSAISFLNPDIALDYRADNRLWLRAAAVLANRRPYRNFFLPAVEDQFIYYLLKKVIKGAVEASHVVQLRNLYRANPFACRERILRFWGGNSACGIERALIHLDLSWFVSQLPELLQKLRKSDPVETIPERVSNRLRDLWRIAKRILYPTGMSVEISGADQQQCSEIAGALLEALAPAFRHVCKWDEDSSVEGISNERGVNRRRLSNISNVMSPRRETSHGANQVHPGGCDT